MRAEFDNVIRWLGPGALFGISYTNMNLKWTKVPEQVDFMTAIKAHNEGKTIICRMPCIEYSFVRRPAGIIDNIGNAISPSQILEGEWYVEE